MKATEFVKKFRELLSVDLELDGPTIELAEGQEAVVECARSGQFTDMNGQVVTFDAANLEALAGTLDAEDALVKIGHVNIETTTPDYGRVTKLAYDSKKDRLLATILPTPALVKKNREEGFRRASMEVSAVSLEGPFGFQHLAFLAARKPGVAGLAPVRLAAAEGERTFVFAEGDAAGAHEFQLDAPPVAKEKSKEALDTATRVALEAEKRATEEKKTMDEKAIKLEADLKLATESAATQKLEVERLRKQLIDGASVRVKAFLAANVKRIPMVALQAGLEGALTAMLADEAGRADAIVLKFSVADGKGADGKERTKEIVESPSACVMRLFAAMPELVTGAQRTEVATSERAAGDGEISDPIAAGGLNPTVKFAKSERHEKALVLLAEMRKTDPKTTFTQALEAVPEKASA